MDGGFALPLNRALGIAVQQELVSQLAAMLRNEGSDLSFIGRRERRDDHFAGLHSASRRRLQNRHADQGRLIWCSLLNRQA